VSGPLEAARFFGLLDSRRGRQRCGVLVLALLVVCAVTWVQYGPVGALGVLVGALCGAAVVLALGAVVLDRRRAGS